jgi:hypothetical protein
MGGILFLLAGAFIAYKKEVKISSKRSITGKAAQRLAALYLATGLLPLVMSSIPVAAIQIFAFILSLILGVGSVIVTLYLVLFYRPKVV